MTAASRRSKPKRTSPKAKSAPKGSARDAILDTAEELFAERGLQAVSLREINVAAGYSIAALHYHFSTRDGVVRALLDRSQPVILDRRQEMLDALADKKQLTVEEIVNTLVLPLLLPLQADAERGSRMLRFLARLYFDRAPQMIEFPEESRTVFLPLLRRALPHLDDQVLTQRWLLAAELTLHALGNVDSPIHGQAKPKLPAAQSRERFVTQLIKFIVSGIAAD